MRIKEVINSARSVASPTYTSRAVGENTPHEAPLDTKLVGHFLRNKNIRLPFVVGLYADKEKTLSPYERVGLLYFTALVTRADEAIDTSPEFAAPLDRSEMAIRLLAQPVWDTNLTLAELTRQTLDHFSIP